MFFPFLAVCTDTKMAPMPVVTAETKIVKQLKLDNTETTDADLQKIVEDNPELVELTLGGTKITDGGLIHLTMLKKLRKIRLSQTEITDGGMTDLAFCERLEDIDLSQTKVGDFGLWELVALPRLKKLNLYWTQVTDEGLDSFRKGDHRSAEKILWLNLDRCAISDAGIPKLAALANLEWLHLGRTELTDAGLEELAKLTSLKEVSITNTKVTKDGVEKFKSAMPGCTVNDNVGAGGE